ncbi:TatD family hydrolase [Cryptosporangium aurantiacum]|uniref:TatD DNase family protein n=1 Tax=Cryptosporangium aurantiacum TaxID=134849 RepID=A0A1M7RJB2_9ACTN|nr:TatD family hydrolase [Cryptosporangium aurantiacum]SHN46387.1 TatD DNase family protein [Cryptosporangium aurantiacum]
MSPREGSAPPDPEPLTTAVLDSHTHLDVQGGDPAAALARAAAVGVTRVVQVGCDVPSSVWAADLAASYPSVAATVAIHPNDVPGLTDLDAALAEIEKLAARPEVRGIGETGLDYYRTGPEGVAAQEESFRAHIQLAKQYGKALVIHDRDAHDDVFRVLESEGAPEKVVFHCYSGDEAMARRCADAGYVMSFAGTLTFKNAQNLRDAAAVAPRELLLVETDGPYLTPMPYRGRPNAPYLIPLIVRALAEVRGEDVDELSAALWATGERVFGPCG